jgi:hypothetical protein
MRIGTTEVQFKVVEIAMAFSWVLGCSFEFSLYEECFSRTWAENCNISHMEFACAVCTRHGPLDLPRDK